METTIKDPYDNEVRVRAQREEVQLWADGETRADFTPAQARDLAAALLRAADEAEGADLNIPDDVFLSAVTGTPPEGAGWRLQEFVIELLEEMLGVHVPRNIFLAKARKLEAQGHLDSLLMLRPGRLPLGAADEVEGKRQ